MSGFSAWFCIVAERVVAMLELCELQSGTGIWLLTNTGLWELFVLLLLTLSVCRCSMRRRRLLLSCSASRWAESRR